MNSPGFSDNPRLRASDADRDRAATVLNSAVAEGRLTAEEHSDRLDAVYAAKTQADIVPLLDDLPGHALAPAPARPAGIARPAEPPEHIVAILSAATRKGAWRPSPVTNVVTFMGGVEIDLREAVLPGHEITISTVCVMGGVQITVPPEMHVVDSAGSIMGACETDGDTAQSLAPGAPVLRLTGLCIMGGVEVKHKARSERDHRDAISG